MSFRLGLTGSIGMGKSTTADMFRKNGVPVWDADATVHALYKPGGAGTDALRSLLPDIVDETGVDRAKLRNAVMTDESLLSKIEALIHPLLFKSREDFLKQNSKSPVLLFDIPLLFETGAHQWLDAIAVVTAPYDIQKKRVLSRPGMTEELFQNLLSKQMPDAEKRDRARFMIDTSLGLEAAENRVCEILEELAG